MGAFSELRSTLSLTEAQVSDLLDISADTFGLFELGKAQPTVAQLQAMRGFAFVSMHLSKPGQKDFGFLLDEADKNLKPRRETGKSKISKGKGTEVRVPFARSGLPATPRNLDTAPFPLQSVPKPRLLDLFCCAGGAGVGYSQAGFEVVGVDINPQPNYPLPFIQADALKLDPKFIALFDAIHASPPCQSYSDLAKRNGNADAWPRLIEPVRAMLRESGLPYVIENVDGAPLLDPVVLCGTMFPNLRVLRHRLFEANFKISTPPHHKHPKVHTFDRRKSHFGKTDEWKDFVQVTGGGNCSLAAARAAMGIDWMTKGEINESIPPAYTEFVGKQLLQHLATMQHPTVRRLG